MEPGCRAIDGQEEDVERVPLNHHQRRDGTREVDEREPLFDAVTWKPRGLRRHGRQGIGSDFGPYCVRILHAL